jgi:predicted  nucleic acid-binding Zn-ribbon protein
MSDSRDRREGPPADSETFQESVSHTADARNIDERELLNQLVSAFWVLDEINGLAPDADASGESTDSSVPGDVPEDVSENPAAPSFYPVSSTPTSSTRSDAEDGDDPSTRSDAEDGDDPSETEPNESLRREFDELRDSIHAQFDMAQSVVELRRQVGDLSLDVDKQRSRQEQFTDRITDDLTRLNRQVEELKTDAGDDTADLERRVDEIDAGLDELESNYHELQGWIDEEFHELESNFEEFERWVDGEFDEIEALFERLLETTDDFEARLDDVTHSIEDVSTFEESQRDLADLRREAFRLGVDEGRCESCDSAVDLSMLSEAACPSCERTFDGIDPSESWNPFAKPTLRTADDSANPMKPPDELDLE